MGPRPAVRCPPAPPMMRQTYLESIPHADLAAILGASLDALPDGTEAKRRLLDLVQGVAVPSAASSVMLLLPCVLDCLSAHLRGKEFMQRAGVLTSRARVLTHSPPVVCKAWKHAFGAPRPPLLVMAPVQTDVFTVVVPVTRVVLRNTLTSVQCAFVQDEAGWRETLEIVKHLQACHVALPGCPTISSRSLETTRKPRRHPTLGMEYTHPWSVWLTFHHDSRSAFMLPTTRARMDVAICPHSPIPHLSIPMVDREGSHLSPHLPSVFRVRIKL